MRSPNKGGSCSSIQRRFNALDLFYSSTLAVRDQEVSSKSMDQVRAEGKGPFCREFPLTQGVIPFALAT
jgi:hypothetical protein